MNGTKEFMGGGISGLGTKSDAKPLPPTHPTQFEKELIGAFQQELGQLRSQVYKLENKIRRYDQAFEAMFKEELDARVNGKQKAEYDNLAAGISPLDRLMYLNKQ